jgi:hypothetical protein
LTYFQDDQSKLKPIEQVFSNESVYFKFISDLIELLNNLLLPRKRNEDFFNGIEELIQNDYQVVLRKAIHGVSSKFYKYSFGEDSYKEISNIGPQMIMKEDSTIEIIIYKEELVNFEDPCYDYLLDLYKLSLNHELSDRFKYEKKNFFLYFFQFFISKNGIETLIKSLSADSEYSSQIKETMFGKTNSQKDSDTFINAKYFMSTQKLIFDILSRLKKYYSSDMTFSFDSNFLKTSSEMSNLEFNRNNRQVSNIVSDHLFDLARISFEFIIKFDLEKSFKHNIFDVVDVIFFTKKIWSEILQTSQNSEFIKYLEKDVIKEKMTNSFFISSVIRIITTYLENPNYSQKMDVASLLNSLESKVNILMEVSRQK